MSKLLKMVGIVALFGALMMAGGCGGGGDEAGLDPSTTTSFAATANANGSATTGATTTKVATAASTTGYLAGVSVSLSPSTTITATNADGTTKVLTAAPSFTFTAPADSTATFSGVHDFPFPSDSTRLVSTSGAIKVEITGAAHATFSPPITITMPVPGKAVGSVIKVFQSDGTTFTLLGSFTVATAEFVSFPVAHMADGPYFEGDPVVGSTTGSGGRTL